MNYNERQDRIEEVEKLISKLEQSIEDKKEELENFELDIDNYIEAYEESLNCEGLVKVVGLEFEASEIIKELDPTAYRCGLNDYVDSLDKRDDKDFQALEEELEMMEDRLTEFEEELEELQEEEELIIKGNV